MKLTLESYLTQKQKLPQTGRHIVAQFNTEAVVVYQAYRPAIGCFAASGGYFGGEFSLNRMSWIKPSFLWMMYRSGWGTKPGQEVILAIWLKRTAFDIILEQAVTAKYNSELYSTKAQWQQAVQRSDVRLQWDPDRTPRGGRLARRAIQLGLRGKILGAYAQDWILHIENISEFVRQQYQIVQGDRFDELLVPTESVYPLADAAIKYQNLQLSPI
ncbi:MAG: DUF4291 domain-containing protein [Pleurocapsa sp.]